MFRKLLGVKSPVPAVDQKPAKPQKSYFEETVSEAREEDIEREEEYRRQELQEAQDVEHIRTLWPGFVDLISFEMQSANEVLLKSQVAMRYWISETKDRDEDDVATLTINVDGEAAETSVACPVQVSKSYRLSFAKIGNMLTMPYESERRFDFDIRQFSRDDFEFVLVKMFKLARGRKSY